MALTKKIAYDKRNFSDIRSELINFTKTFYPDLISSFNDASIYSLLIELNAATADMLSYHSDRQFNEAFLEFSQERKSILGHAKTMGFKLPNVRPAITIVDFSIKVPPFGDTFSKDYLPLLRSGSQAIGGGSIFETVEDIDFSDPFGPGGTPNRLIIPQIDANDKIQSYTITKRELVTNGVSKIFKRVITIEDLRPFFEIILPDKDISSIEQVISLEGTNFTRTPTIDEFLSDDRRFFEVDYLAQSAIFKEDFTRVSDRSGIVPGKWVDITKKIIKEFTDKGFCKLTFGGGDPNSDTFGEVVKNTGYETQIGDFLNNTALGETVVPGTTIFVRYRVSNGANSNKGRNVLTEVGNVNMVINGSRAEINRAVRASLTVNNPIPALGGMDQLSTEQIRKLISYNFSAQERCITVRDYMSRIMKIPGKFGAPFRVSVFEEQNKIKIKILALDENGKLDNSSTNTLMQNIAEYLSEFRMLNDYIEVSNGRIINLAFDIEVFIDEAFNKSEISASIISEIESFMDINKRSMNDNIYLGKLIETITNVSGVINLLRIIPYNKIGEGKYSLNEISQSLKNNNTREIDTPDQVIWGEPNSMFEIKNINKDVRIFVKSGRITI